MPRYFIKLSYDGTNYHGWQSQDNAHTVQAELENTLSVILKENIQITGAGRTDTGVHARNYFAHFDVETIFNKEQINDLVYRLNSVLPLDISILNVFPVKNEAHARFTAISRTYKYYICRSKDPFNNNYAWRIYGDLDVDAMNEAANTLFDYVDFTSFSKLHTDVKTNNCKILHVRWTEENGLLVFTIIADRFLRNMVRAIVGTLIDVGKGKISLAEFRKIIESKNRCDAGYSVPAQGLFLEEIKYPEDIFEL
ncbi:MAG: tRNA pseudouridine(38-40) synthase TruA [Bacteroidales bacterium]|jgi:tRNA pseudouridine38-40 synthase